jgi:hypothetical protein
MTRRICLAFAVILGLAGATLAVAGMTAHGAAACEGNHTS